MRSSGIKDRYGKEIKEGDTIKVGRKIMKVVVENDRFYTPFGKSTYRLSGWITERVELIQ